MIPAGYKESLVTYAETMGAKGVQEITDEYVSLFALSRENKGLSLINSSINGKAFGFNVDMTVEEKFTVFGAALREINGDGPVVNTIPDFRCLRR